MTRVPHCQRPGCDRPCYEKNGEYFKYCGNTCRAANQQRTVFSPPAGYPPEDAVTFYHRHDPYYEFSNFYEPPHGILVDGELWKSTEAYFQASKFKNAALARQFLSLSPREAFDLAHEHSSEVRSDWHSVSTKVMQKAVTMKFLQYPDLQKLLVRTANRTIIEHTPNDSFWGDGGDGTGANNLGYILMAVRELLANFHFDNPAITLPKL